MQRDDHFVCEYVFIWTSVRMDFSSIFAIFCFPLYSQLIIIICLFQIHEKSEFFLSVFSNKPKQTTPHNSVRNYFFFCGFLLLFLLCRKKKRTYDDWLISNEQKSNRKENKTIRWEKAITFERHLTDIASLLLKNTAYRKRHTAAINFEPHQIDTIHELRYTQNKLTISTGIEETRFQNTNRTR